MWGLRSPTLPLTYPTDRTMQNQKSKRRCKIMDNDAIKKCPFNCKECMEEDCRLYDEEYERCEFENVTNFINECFNDLIKEIRNI